MPNAQVTLCLRAALCAGLWLSMAEPAVAEESFEGVYEGTLHLQRPVARDVPIAFSLTMTGEVVVLPGGTRQNVIDSSFLVDEEGGVFPFSEVAYDYNEGHLNLVYARPGFGEGTTSPAFQLDGRFESEERISGRVLSGLRGNLGEFVVEKSKARYLKRRSKYRGYWAGSARTVPDGEIVQVAIELTDSRLAQINPASYEFDYTPGKTGFYSWNGTKSAITQASIDYLTGHLSLVSKDPDGSTAVILECDLDPDTGALKGTLMSRFRARRAEFVLEPK